MYPSILAHIAGGIVLVFSVIVLIVYFPKILSLDVYRILILIMVFSIAISVHGISHLGLEKEYEYSPYPMFPAPKHTCRCKMKH